MMMNGIPWFIAVAVALHSIFAAPSTKITISAMGDDDGKDGSSSSENGLHNRATKRNMKEEDVEEEMFDTIIRTNEEFDTDVVEGDIKTDDYDDAGRETRSAVRDLNKLWPGGKIYYVLSNYLDPSIRRFVILAMHDIESRTCISFQKRTNEKDYLNIYNGDGCWSWVGRRLKKQQLSLSSHGCRSKGIAVHELIHAIGFWHEQARTDRDEYINIIWDNVKYSAKGNFKKRSSKEAQTFTKYDFDSIMHYSAKAFSRNGRNTIEAIGYSSSKLGQRKHLTDRDVAGINHLYGCKVTTRGGQIISSKTTNATDSNSTDSATPTAPTTKNNATTPKTGATSSNITTTKLPKYVVKLRNALRKASAKGVPKTLNSIPTATKTVIPKTPKIVPTSLTAAWMTWSTWGECNKYSCHQSRVRSCNQTEPVACGPGGRMSREHDSKVCHKGMRCQIPYWRRIDERRG